MEENRKELGINGGVYVADSSDLCILQHIIIADIAGKSKCIMAGFGLIAPELQPNSRPESVRISGERMPGNGGWKGGTAESGDIFRWLTRNCSNDKLRKITWGSCGRQINAAIHGFNHMEDFYERSYERQQYGN